MSDNTDNEILDSDSDVPTTSLYKQLLPSAVVVTSNNETSTKEEERSELQSYDDKTSDMWCKTDKKPSNEPFLGTTGLHIVIDNRVFYAYHSVNRESHSSTMTAGHTLFVYPRCCEYS
jgi:hypothetical protein